MSRKPNNNIFSGVVVSARAQASDTAGDEVGEALSKWHALFEGEEEDQQDRFSLNRPKDDDFVSAAEVRDAFCKSMAFGTAGLRAKEGLGFNRMNEITVALTSQGIADYILREEEACRSDSDSSPGCVAIGFDGRTGSRAFARSAAMSFASKGIHVLLFDDVIPTPLLAFVTRSRSCRCGVMVTASHNPKEYNGYKVYWSNGCQIVPPIDERIADSIASQQCLSTRTSE
jgi:phosphomannomutase